jgi:uncharacterized protein (TIGR02594 family)
MIESTTFVRRSLHIVALALSSAVIAASATPASARSHHGGGHHAHHASHHAHNSSHAHAHHGRRYARASRFERGMAAMRARGLERSQASLTGGSESSGMTTSGGFGSNVVAEARRYLGGNPTGRGRLWCARFMNLVLERTGHHGTGSDMARSFAHYGQPVSGPQVGAIAVMGRRGGGGHVGVVSGIDAQGNPIVISGNYGHRVREVPMSRGRIYAYVMPN